MNFLKIADGITSLFPKKIAVKLIDEENGTIIGVYKMEAEQLPVSFIKPTIIKADNKEWRVLKADMVSDEFFLRGKKLVLYVQSNAAVNEKELYFNQPTVYNDLPTINNSGTYHHFTIELQQSDWRQIEFLPLDFLPKIEEEIKAIEAVLASHPNALLGYKQQHIRQKIVAHPLAIDATEFHQFIGNDLTGNISLENSGFVQNGFALRSDNHSYYGIIEKDIILTLCLTQFYCAEDELMDLLTRYNLVLVDWCNVLVLATAVNEEREVKAIHQDIID